MLYLVATPIGNLSDITLRAIETLKSCDLILCEDTRHSLTLFRHYEIQKPLKSLHQFNERQTIEPLIERLKKGESLCLVSDAGTPLLSDPGYPLLCACIEEEIPVTALPGPCALIDALILSGLPTHPFQFLGFLPQKKSDLAETIASLLTYKGTTVCYESPHRILETIELLEKIIPLREACLARELTKKFESFLRGTIRTLAQKISQEAPRGELVLLIKGAPFNFSDLYPSALDLANQLENIFKIPKKEAIKIAAELTHEDKRALYKKSFAN